MLKIAAREIGLNKFLAVFLMDCLVTLPSNPFKIGDAGLGLTDSLVVRPWLIVRLWIVAWICLAPAVLPAVLSAGFFSSREAHAEFIQTSSGVLQSSDRRAKMIVSYRVPGIFIVLGEPIDLQLFDPAKLELPSSTPPLNPAEGKISESNSPGITHLFVEYNPQLDRYSNLHVGQQSFRIKGGFTLHKELAGQRLRVTVDNNNPYLSVVYEPVDGSSTSAPSIVGFRGIQTVVNKAGMRYAALLEANQFNQFKGLIEPYGLLSGVLTLKGINFSGSSIGVELEPQKNSCLGKNSSFISQAQLSSLKNSSDRGAALKELESLLKTAPQQDPFKGVLLLRVNPSEILGLDYGRERVITVRPLPKAKQSICIIEEIPLG